VLTLSSCAAWLTHLPKPQWNLVVSLHSLTAIHLHQLNLHRSAKAMQVQLLHSTVVPHQHKAAAVAAQVLRAEYHFKLPSATGTKVKKGWCNSERT